MEYIHADKFNKYQNPFFYLPPFSFRLDDEYIPAFTLIKYLCIHEIIYNKDDLESSDYDFYFSILREISDIGL